MQVIKRDGRVVEFDKSRIVNAIIKSMAQTTQGVDIDLAKRIANGVERQFDSKEQFSVYEIQDLVEKKLMGSTRKEVAQSYITYRYNRDVARKSKTKDIFLDIISEKSNDVLKDKINTNLSTPKGVMMKFASETTKPFVDDFLLEAEVREAEKNGYINIHDKSYYPTKAINCVQHPLNEILEKGLKSKVSSLRPVERIETSIELTCTLLELVQNEVSEGQSIPAIDYFLAPYVKKAFKEEIEKIGEDLDINISELLEYQPKDYIKKEINQLKTKDRIIQIAINRTVERVHQSIEALIHNLNTIKLKGGNELINISINYGTDTSAEGRCIIREILQTTYEGIGNSETPILPIQIWKKKKGINYLPEDRNYDLYQLALKVTIKRFYPNYINLDASFNKNEKWKKEDTKRWYYEAADLGNGIRIFENRHGERTPIARGILSYTTINLPKIAIESVIKAQEKLGISFDIGIGSEKSMTEKYKTTVKKIFMNELEKYTTIISHELYQRFKFQGTAIAKQFPVLMSNIWIESQKLYINDKIEEIIKHGILGIKFVGLAECLVALTGKHHGESDEAQKLGIEIINELNELAEEFSEKYNLNYEIMATAEEELEKLVKKDISNYGIISGVTDRKYYTNGNYIPKWYQCTAEHKAKIEAPYHKYCKAGNEIFIELDDGTLNNEEKLKKALNLMEEYDIGYMSINHKKIKCSDCGYEEEETRLVKCPKCGSPNLEILQKNSGNITRMNISLEYN